MPQDSRRWEGDINCMFSCSACFATLTETNSSAGFVIVGAFQNLMVAAIDENISTATLMFLFSPCYGLEPFHP